MVKMVWPVALISSPDGGWAIGDRSDTARSSCCGDLLFVTEHRWIVNQPNRGRSPRILGLATTVSANAPEAGVVLGANVPVDRAEAFL
jgi:hypothetical protein